MAANFGEAIRDERLRRRLSLRDVAERAGVSAALVLQLESGGVVSLETYARVATALDLRPELSAMDSRKRGHFARTADLVHAAMGEAEAGHLRPHGFRVALDEPYQHFQFAGRGDLVAWDIDNRAFLHLENKTQFPNIQEAIGSYNAKRAYLAPVLAERLGIGSRGWRSVTHALVVLWSTEALRQVREHAESFRAVCPDTESALGRWWAGQVPEPGGPTSTLVLFDPAPRLGRSRALVGLDRALEVRARYRNYADAAEHLGTRPGLIARPPREIAPGKVG